MTRVSLHRTVSFVLTALLLGANDGLACSTDSDCTSPRGVGATCFQGSCQQAAAVGRSYLDVRETASTAARIAFYWDSPIVLNGVDGAAAELDPATTLVADGPFNHLNYANGTADFRALNFAPVASGGYAMREDYVHSGDFDGNFTASAYVYHSSTTPQDGTWDTVMEASGRFVVAVQSTTGKVRASLYNHDPYVEEYDYHVETASGAIRKNEWHRIRVAHWGSGESDGTTRIWVDERELVSQPFTAAVQSDYFAEDWDSAFVISSGVLTASWYGRITGVWALNEPLAPGDVDSRVRAAFDMAASSVIVQNGLNSYTDMLAISYPKAADRRVTFYSSPTALDSPVVDETNPMSWLSTRVFSLSSADRPTMINNSALRYLTAATYEAWVNRSLDSGGVEFLLHNNNFVMKILANDQVLCQFIDGVAPTQKPGAVSTTSIALDQWYHVSCSFDGLTTRTWVNGVNEASANVTAGTPGYYASGTGNLQMGRAPYGFVGKMTGIKVWDRARPPEGGCGSKCTFTVAPSEACYDIVAQAASTCGDFAVSTDQLCETLCTSAQSCNTACGDTSNLTSTCGAESLPCSSLSSGVADLGLIYSASLSPKTSAGAPRVSFREDMHSGRISNMILTKYLAFPVDTGGGAYLSIPPTTTPARFAAVCSDWDDADGATNVSDSSMIVIVRDTGDAVVATYYNDDSTAAAGNGKGSYIEHIPAHSTWTYRYYVYVYSNRINTALCELRYTTNGSPVQTGTIGASQRHIGGTMVRVGPLPQSDYFQIQLIEGASPLENRYTRMALFRLAGGAPTGQLLSGTVGGGDNDAHLTVTGTAHDDSAENYILVGKKTNVHFSPGDASETVIRADLVHGTQGTKTVGPTIYRQSSSGGPPYVSSMLALTVPGRYVVGVDIMTTDPVGSTLVQSNPIPISDPNDATLVRGRMNSPAIDWTIEGAPAGLPPRPLAPVRKIPLGAFGSTNYHRFYQEIEVVLPPNNPTFYVKPVFTNPTMSSEFGPINLSYENGIIVAQSWFVQRNADAAQLRVATANMWYRSEPREYEFKNVADLLAARGVPSATGDFSFSDPSLRGPFQFNADIVHMTEMGGHGCEGTCFDDVVLDQRIAFRTTAQDNDSRRWTEIYGRDEDWPTLDGGGAVFVAESQWPNFGTCPLNVTNSHSSCYDTGCQSANYMACWMNDDGYGIGDTAFIPAATAVRSLLRQPILVIGTHLTYGANRWGDTAGGGARGRSAQLGSLADIVQALVAAQPGVVRNGASSIADRIIIAGDLNLNSHGWGEHYKALRQLRARFGYAVDVALAIDNSYGEDVGAAMHDIMGLGDGCRQTTAEWADLPAMSPRFDPRLDCSGALRYPWWSRTSYCDDCENAGSYASVSGDRVDFFILVGRGWEMDDPVRGYRVMQEPSGPVNPFAPPSGPGRVTGLGVNMWGVEQNASGANYKPRFDIGYGTDAGCAAIETDHRPIGATLRIWSGADAR